MRLNDDWLNMLPLFADGDGGGDGDGAAGDEAGDEGKGGEGDGDGDGTGKTIATGKTDDSGGDGDAPKGTDDAGAPEKYEFAMADGTALNVEDPLIEAAVPVFKELGLSQEKAQKLIDLDLVRRANDAAAFDKTKAGWENEIRKDVDLGGDNFQATVRSVQGVVRKFDPEGTLTEALDSTGLGSHPALVRFLKRVAVAIGEDDSSGGSSGAVSTDPEAAMAAKFYGGKKAS